MPSGKEIVTALALLCVGASAQQAGTIVDETHPPLNVMNCDDSGCTQQSLAITVDSNWRWFEKDGTNCFTGNVWDETECPSTEEGAVQCTADCSLEGATYEESYGITSQDDSLTLAFVTKSSPGDGSALMKGHKRGESVTEELTNVGSRTYLMSSDEDKYQMFYLKNREFSFDVDASNLPCGLNGALYFVEMAEDGGMSDYDGNNAGAKFGTGYCDAQCPHDLKFINGEANVLDWVPSDNDPNAGTGRYGTCCTEMDIWEANSISSAYTPHTCDVQGQTRCGEGTDVDCGDIDDNNPESRYEGACDKDGCDLNPWRYDVYDYYGPGDNFKVNSLKPMTVVTQFITSDNTDTGDLTEIRRFYVQDGKTIENQEVNVGGTTYDSITDQFCADSRKFFEEPHDGYKDHGGMKGMGEALDRGMVLVMSMWDDHYAHMLWLDSTYPVNGTVQGNNRGSCPTSSGDPTDVEVNVPNSTVTYSNIRFGTIGSTTK